MIVESNSGEDAAIAGATAAAVYGAEIIAESIEDNVQNFTRFLLLARRTARLPSERLRIRPTEDIIVFE